MTLWGAFCILSPQLAADPSFGAAAGSVQLSGLADSASGFLSTVLPHASAQLHVGCHTALS